MQRTYAICFLFKTATRRIPVKLPPATIGIIHKIKNQPKGNTKQYSKMKFTNTILSSLALVATALPPSASAASLRRRLKKSDDPPPPRPDEADAGGQSGASDAVPTSGIEGTYSLVNSFSVPKSPSGMYYEAKSDILYILCGTQTNGDHTLYAYTPEGGQLCEMNIPSSTGMSRVDGFYIDGSGSAYIVDSQGPLYADQGKLGGSVYQVDWTNPCSCADGACAQSSITWYPTVTKTFVVSASDIGDGGDFFRNSGIVVTDDSYFAINGVHPSNGSPYPKSLVKASLSTNEVEEQWAFTGTQGVGRDVDMEGLTCGADNCSDFMYIGDEYQYIYKLALNETDIDNSIKTYWNVRSVAGDVSGDKGIEALAYADGYFYAGIQETAMVHVIDLAG